VTHFRRPDDAVPVDILSKIVPLTERQLAVVDHGEGPLRVTGGYATGKTTALRARVERLATAQSRDRVLVICRSAGAARHFDDQATTFWGVALDILARYRRPRRVLSRRQQRGVVDDLLRADQARWPILAAAVDDVGLLQELADAVCRYQASWLGVEELRTHADAAGQLERWEQLADFTNAYLEALDRAEAVDWAGALVQAALVLRDPDAAQREQSRFDHVLVDNFEQLSFASHRLLVALAGPGSNIVACGNLDGPLIPATGGSRKWLDRFTRSFDTTADITLGERLVPAGSAAVVEGTGPRSQVAIDELTAAHAEGIPWSEMSVVCCQWDDDREDVLDALIRGGVPSVMAEGPDPWDAVEPSDEAVSIVSVDGCATRTWAVVVVIGCVESGLHQPMRQPQLLDVELFSGPDVPAPEQRAQRWAAEERRRFELLQSRATDRLVFLASPTANQPASRFPRDIPRR
jgi:superfamily I DNA/RNA helicase